MSCGRPPLSGRWDPGDVSSGGDARSSVGSEGSGSTPSIASSDTILSSRAAGLVANTSFADTIRDDHSDAGASDDSDTFSSFKAFSKKVVNLLLNLVWQCLDLASAALMLWCWWSRVSLASLCYGCLALWVLVVRPQPPNIVYALRQEGPVQPLSRLGLCGAHS